MATYEELYEVGASDPKLARAKALQEKVTVALAIAAETIYGEDVGVPNHVNRLIWAKQAFASPGGKKSEMLFALLAQNAGSTIDAILTASDATVQTAVDAAVDVFADGTE